MPELISPTTRLRDSWLASRDEWGRGTHQDGSGLHSDDDVDTLAGFTVFVERLCRQSDMSIPLERVLVTCDDGNVASARTIEKAGGVLEDVRDTELGHTRRYWITL